MGYQLRTRWLEGFEHDDDDEDVRKTLEEAIAMLRDIQATLDKLQATLDGLEPGDPTTPQAPAMG